MGSGNCKADCYANKDRNKLQIISTLEHRDVSLLMPNADGQTPQQADNPHNNANRHGEDEHQSEQEIDAPQIHIVELHQHLVVPHSIIDRKLNEKLKLLVRKELPESPILDSTSIWYLLGSGSYYSGPFHFNKSEGLGTYILSNGIIFYGHVHNEEPEGTGTLISETGTFKGTFMKGQAHGSGILEAQGVLVDGQWEDGEIINGTVKTKEYSYSGQFKDGLPDGEGKFSGITSKITMAGHFKKGHLDGYNCTYSSPEYTYTGSYKEGRRHGKGTMLFAQQGKFDGSWDRDKFVPEHS